MINALPLISVLIPTYNRKELLKRAIESVRLQDYKNIEIYVSDNASTDGTSEIMNEYIKMDSRIIYNRREENTGPLYNGSEAYSHLKGKYAIILCDDDYFISETFFSNAVKVMEENDNIVIVGGIVKYLNENTNDIFIASYNFKEYIKGIDYFLNYGLNNITSFFAMFRKEAGDKTRVFQRALPSGDTWIWLYLFLFGDIYFLSNEIIGCYTEHGLEQDSYNIKTLENVDYMLELIDDLKNKASNLYPNYSKEINIKVEKIFAEILVWHTVQLCKVIGKKKAFKIMKSKEIIKKYPRIRSRIFGILAFIIPFKFILFGLEIEEKFFVLFIFGIRINIKRIK